MTMTHDHLHAQSNDEVATLKARIAELERMDTEHTVQIAKMNAYTESWRKRNAGASAARNCRVINNGYSFITIIIQNLPQVLNCAVMTKD